MTRVSAVLMVTFVSSLAWGDEPTKPAVEGGDVTLTPENRLEPVAYGDTAQFWETHTFVIGKVEETRVEYDAEKVIAREHLCIRVKKSIPDRYAHGERLTKVVERLVVAYDRPAEPPLPQYHVGDKLLLIVSPAKPEFRSFAMMPGGHEVCAITAHTSAQVAQTKRLCQALATADLQKRLVLIEALLKEQPSSRMSLVLKRRLETTTAELQGRLQEAAVLLEKVAAADPQPGPTPAPLAREESMSGIITALSGRVVVLKDPQFFSVNGKTQYFRETGRDPAETNAGILAAGTAVMAVGSKDEDGEFVASRVYALLGNVLR